MPVLDRFDTPARLPEPDDAGRDAWSARVAGLVAPLAARFTQFFDPTATDVSADAVAPPIVWNAFPATLLQSATSQEQRWRTADASRHRQDEYCEWSVERDGAGTVTRVTFTTEVPEYYEHLAAQDPDRLLALYRELVGPHVQPDELIVGGRYVRENVHNRSTEGRLVHLVQRNNTLGAAIVLAAEATVLRHDAAGEPVTTAQALVRCGGLGEPLRNSDPQIAAATNDAAATGAEVSLLDPMGLYLDGLLTAGMRTPDGEDPATFWTIERGDAEHALRAGYAVPPERGYAVGDITLDGRPIRFGAQLADRVGVRLTALVDPAGHRPVRLPCVA
ncbi:MULTISPECIES: hypothetical protein [unclassified Modestobacter]|uniref:hypothetical protein n=1 Tax=unclassified Modestobacter TaxID=2643866 RepID=UPI0022AA6F73|nr:MULTISPECIES: hypothetical protein [unclassified Modestobacter]MCZ2826536.1 hypothetical protein [Modestobacter sp. VKM Ac-2981]MCZ2852399.1 hypothetical protein [Modestobacter sp. VKM Ac-2982]